MTFDNSLFEWLGISHKRIGEGWMCYCPFHKGGSRTPPMGVNPKGNDLVYHCFACGASGKLPNLVAHVKGVSYEEAVNLLEKKFYVDSYKSNEEVEKLNTIGDNIPKWDERGDKEIILSESILDLYDVADPTGYLKRRDITQVTMDRLEIGYDRWKERVTFPIRNADGKLIGIVGRSVNDSLPKYLFYDFEKSHYLYGMDRVIGDSVVLVEGHIDVVWAVQNGLNNAISLQGCILSERQADWISSVANDVTLALDNDTAGEKGTRIAYDMLKNRVRNLYVVNWQPFSPGKDIADLSREGIKKLMEEREHAVNVFATKF